MSGISGYYPSSSYGTGYGSGYGYPPSYDSLYGTGAPPSYDSLYGTGSAPPSYSSLYGTNGTPASGDVNLVSSSTEAGGSHGAAPAEEKHKSEGGFFQGIWDGFKHAVSSLFTPTGFLMAAAGVAACIAFPVAAPLILGGLAVAGGGYMMYKGATTGDSHQAGEGFFTAAMGGLGMWGGAKAIGTGEAKTPTGVDGAASDASTANASKVRNHWWQFWRPKQAKEGQTPAEVSPAGSDTASIRDSEASLTEKTDAAIIQERNAPANNTGNAGEARTTSESFESLQSKTDAARSTMTSLRSQAKTDDSHALELEQASGYSMFRTAGGIKTVENNNKTEAAKLRSSAIGKREEADRLEIEIKSNEAQLNTLREESAYKKAHMTGLKTRITGWDRENLSYQNREAALDRKIEQQQSYIDGGWPIFSSKPQSQIKAEAETEKEVLVQQKAELVKEKEAKQRQVEQAKRDLAQAPGLSPVQIKVQGKTIEDLPNLPPAEQTALREKLFTDLNSNTLTAAEQVAIRKGLVEDSGNLSVAQQTALREKMFTELKSPMDSTEQAAIYTELTKGLNSRNLPLAEEAVLRGGLIKELKNPNLKQDGRNVIEEELATHYSTSSDRLTSADKVELRKALVGRLDPKTINTGELSAAKETMLREDLMAELQSSKVSNSDKAVTREALVDHYKTAELTTAEQTALRDALIKDMKSRNLSAKEQALFKKELEPSKATSEKETSADPKAKLSWGERSKQQRHEVANRFRTFGGNIKEYGYNKNLEASKPRKIWNGTWETANQLRRPMWSVSSTGPLAGFGMPEQQA